MRLSTKSVIIAFCIGLSLYLGLWVFPSLSEASLGRGVIALTIFFLMVVMLAVLFHKDPSPEMEYQAVEDAMDDGDRGTRDARYASQKRIPDKYDRKYQLTRRWKR